MLAVVSCPAISSPVPSCAASLTLSSPALTRSARSDTASSAGFSILASTSWAKVLVQAHRALHRVLGGGVPREADIGVMLEHLGVLVRHAQQLADHQRGHR